MFSGSERNKALISCQWKLDGCDVGCECLNMHSGGNS
jgi:hypothetical protein